jgi:predicted nuclease with TOPRIM domain
MKTNGYGQPPYTCPLIDRVKDNINQFIKDNESEDFSDLEQCLDLMEEIRTANSLLRDCSTEYIDKFENEEGKANDLQDEINKLENQLDKLQEQYNDLQSDHASDVEALNEQIDELNDRLQYNY